jgi:large subunit ribosomal protein L10
LVSTPKKETEVRQLEGKFREATAAILTDFRGLKVADVTALRNLLRKSKIEFRVVKNRLAKIATQNTSMADLDPLLSGPTGVAFGYDDPVASSKILSQFLRSNANLDIKGGVIQGRLYRKEEILAIAELPPRDILLSHVLMSMAAPLSGWVRVLQAPIHQFMGTLDAIRIQKEKGS